ncbi:MAG: PilZ domain-containing protein [Sphingomonas sp.]
MSDQPGADQQLRSPRKNVLLSATIEAGKLKVPVRIRNLSESGAMLDGAALPDLGAVLTLRRLQVEIGATVIWCEAGRCGVAFDGLVSVEDWVAGNCLPVRFVKPGQARVDEIQSALRRGDAPLEEAPPPSRPVPVGELEQHIAAEIGMVRRLLETVADELSEDPALLMRYAEALQRFDFGCQVLSHLAAVLSAPDRAAAVAGVTMEELRLRLLQKPVS